jgi:molybdopterin-guanine dinucleotide biosynthesis protein A
LLESVVRGAALHAERVIVVGQRSAHAEADGFRDVIWTREDPPGGGPVAAVAAALAVVDTEIVLLLAGDAPNGPDAAPALLDALAADPTAAAAIIVDSDGRSQFLCGAYRAAVLRARLDDLAEVRRAPAVRPGAERSTHAPALLHGAAMRDLVVGLVLVHVPDRWGSADDIDTRADADRLGFT